MSCIARARHARRRAGGRSGCGRPCPPRSAGSACAITGLRMSASMKSVRSSRAPRRAHVEARDVLDARVALEAAGQLRAEVARHARDQDAAAGHFVFFSAPLFSASACDRASRRGLRARRLRLRPRLAPRALELAFGAGVLSIASSCARRAQLVAQRLDRPCGRAPRLADRLRRARRSRAAPRRPDEVVERLLRARARLLAPPTVACTVRSTASRTASGSRWGVVRRSPSARSVPYRRAAVPSPIHLKPAAELAERVLLPGDPHRALAVAQALIEQPRMFNHHRGLWGYTGTARDGEPLTIQATGMGGPSAAIVVEELIALGARTLIRIGTCGALVDRARARRRSSRSRRRWAPDGTSRALGADGRVEPDAEPDRGARRGAGARRRPRLDRPLLRPARGPADALADRRRERVEMEARRCSRSPGCAAYAAACLLGVTDQLARRARPRTARATARGSSGSSSARRPGRRWSRRLALGAARRPSAAPAPAAAAPPGRHAPRGARRGRARPPRGAPRACSPARRSARRPVAAAARRRAAPRAGRRASSIASSRWQTDRRRRVSRSMSAADGMSERPHRHVLRLDRLLARLECARERAGDQRVAGQLLGQLAERLLALAGERSFRPSSVGSATARTVPDPAQRSAGSRLWV